MTKPFFNKPPLKNTELVQQWIDRGLTVSNPIKAEYDIHCIGYYRLSAYAIPFYQPNSTELFIAGTVMDSILDLYTFDSKLRNLFLQAIESIEMSLRSLISDHMSLKYNDCFWYKNKSYFDIKYKHEVLLQKIQKMIDEEDVKLQKDISKVSPNTKKDGDEELELIKNIKKENFIRHYITSYDRSSLLPSWMMVETLTFGELQRLFYGINMSDKEEIAQKLSVYLNQNWLVSWLKHINHVRNLCAHGNRLWNRTFGISPKIPTFSTRKPREDIVIPWWEDSKKETKTEKLYRTLMVLQSLLFFIDPLSDWAKQIKALLDKYEQKLTGQINFLDAMGIPSDWHTDAFWKRVL